MVAHHRCIEARNDVPLFMSSYLCKNRLLSKLFVNKANVLRQQSNVVFE